jgi:hypothetical protein
MELISEVAGLVLVFAGILTMVSIVRESFPYLDQADQASFRNWRQSSGISTRFDRAIHHAWTEHARAFPRSSKRFLFACLLIAAVLSLFVHPLWLAFGPR